MTTPVAAESCGECGYTEGHNPSCATGWAFLTTPELIAGARSTLMAWTEQAARYADQDVSAIVAAAAAGISARARQLGLEHDLPGDYDHLKG